MGTPYIARYSDIITDAATITVTAGSEDTAYPKTKLQDRKAHTVAKFSGTSGTFRATFGASKTLQAVAIINSNATAIQLTNGAGLNQAIAIPTTPEDGHQLDPWIDLRALGSTSSNIWSIALTGPAGVRVGELLLVETLRALPMEWTLQEEEEHRSSRLETDYGVQLKYGFGVRQRRVTGKTTLETYRAGILALQRGARGGLREFLLILDSGVNDALYVDLFTDSRQFTRNSPGGTDVNLTFLEAQKGLA